MATRKLPYRLAIVATHPVQYQAPWYRSLGSHPDLDLEVLYCHQATSQEQSAAGFGVAFDWDVPLLGGYAHRFLPNVATTPSLSTFRGLNNPSVRDAIRAGGYDAVLVSGWHFQSAWQAIAACWRSRTPVMVRGDSHLRTERPLAKRAAKSLLYRTFVPRFDACLAVGAWSREYYLHYGARPDRVFQVPHAVDGRWFSREAVRWQERRLELRRRWGFDHDTVLFVFAGKMIGKKRPLDFVQAVAAAARCTPRVGALVVGDGPLRGACEAAAARLAAPIRFLGFLNQSCVAQAYVAGDALVLPSDGGETWGLVVDEAMACGRAAIVSDRVGCGPDLIVPGETGEVFPMGDVDALADTLAGCAADPARLSAMGAQARERAAAHSLDAAVDGVMQALRAVTVAA